MTCSLIISSHFDCVGGFDKESDPLPMILRSGDILVMGGKSRLRVHAVPKVFTKTLPPLYLHPSTVGRDVIHQEECSHFLKGGILDGCSCGGDVAGKLLTSCEASDNNTPAHSKRSTTVSLDVACKKQRHGQSADESAANNENNNENENENGNNTSGICSTQIDIDSSRNGNSYSDDDGRKANSIEGGVDGEVDTKNKDTNAAKCCTGLTPVRETRVLKYLQTTRININVRQVYATQPKQEDGQKQDQDHYQEQGQEQEQEQAQRQEQKTNFVQRGLIKSMTKT
jgi:hypothetical protein